MRMPLTKRRKYDAALPYAPAARGGLVLDLELALFGHALESLAGILDPVLIIFAV
jgi:hypothetical protein